MKYIYFLVIISITTIFLISSCKTGNEGASKIILSNQSGMNLTDKAICIQQAELKQVPDKEIYPLIISENGDTVPSQLDDLNNDGTWDQLFFVADIPANKEISLNLNWVKEKPEYIVRTSVRFGKRSSGNTPVVQKTSDTLLPDKVHKALGYEPYQTDGPMWENDKVGFRHYFDGRNSNDLFGKKVSYMSPDSVGINFNGDVVDNYHVMANWGRDILSVGNSVGIGGFGLMASDSIMRLGITGNDTLNNVEKSIFTIVSEGPVHSVMHFDYQNWHAGNRLYNVEETTSIWPGMYAYNNNVRISGLKGDETLLIGLVNSNTDKPLSRIDIGDKYVVLYTHDKQTYDKTWYLGLALILPAENYVGYGEAPHDGPFTNTYFGKLKIENDKPVNYYAAACWEIADQGFSDSTYFRNYIEDLASQLAADVTIKIE